MLLHHDMQISCNLYNRTFAPNTLQAKTLDVRLSRQVSSGEALPFGELEVHAALVTGYLHKAHVVWVQDPILIRLLEPKNGSSVHPFLDKLKNSISVADSYQLLSGEEIPPNTVNANKVLVVADKSTPSLEGLARFILLLDTSIHAVVVRDGANSVETAASDLEKTLL